MTEIRFGTDGWRAVIGQQFTFDEVRRVTAAIAVAAQQFDPPEDVDRGSMVVGYDRRFLSADFARAAAEELADAGLRVLLSDSPLPSQAVSFTAWKRRVIGGVVITASHNPARYNGVKFKGWYGGSALSPMYDAIASSVGQRISHSGGSVTETDFLTDYCSALRERLDLATLSSRHLRILHDPIFGVAAGLPARIVKGTGVEVETIRGESNPSFGGVNPEPIPENLEVSIERMKAGGFDLAICNDGDADRVGILDERGEFVSPHKLIALLALYLSRHRGLSGEIIKTFSTTRLVEQIARELKIPLHETAIGFKYVADLMLTRPILIGGEESGGIGFGSFLPERDGILSGLLTAECIAAYGKPLSRIIDEMEGEFGALHYDRRDLSRPMERCQMLIDRATAGELDSVFDTPVSGRESTDGVKLNFEDGSWLLLRKSGTEPIIRIYCESPDRGRLRHILDGAVVELDRD